MNEIGDRKGIGSCKGDEGLIKIRILEKGKMRNKMKEKKEDNEGKKSGKKGEKDEDIGKINIDRILNVRRVKGRIESIVDI